MAPTSIPLRCSRIVLCSLAYAVVRVLLDILIVRGHSNTRLRAEVLALRHQLRVLERQVGRPRWQPADRILLAAASRILPRPDWLFLLPRPQTLLQLASVERAIRAHFFLCVLAYLLENHLGQRLEAAQAEVSARAALEAMETLRVVDYDLPVAASSRILILQHPSAGLRAVQGVLARGQAPARRWTEVAAGARRSRG